MLKVKNTGPKVIGFGAMHILPGEVKELPPGFGADHPTVKFFIDRGWLTRASDGGVLLTGTTAEPPKPPANNDAPPTDNKTPSSDNSDSGDKIDVSKLTARDVGRMNRDPLRALATQLEISFEEADTRATLITKISAALFPEEEACIEEPHDEQE